MQYVNELPGDAFASLSAAYATACVGLRSALDAGIITTGMSWDYVIVAVEAAGVASGGLRGLLDPKGLLAQPRPAAAHVLTGWVVLRAILRAEWDRGDLRARLAPGGVATADDVLRGAD